MVNGYTAVTLREALELRGAREVVPYAGGTDLMMEHREDVTYLFLGKIPELRAVRADGEYLRLGAASTFTELLEHPKTPGLLKEALGQIAAPAIRNLGTIGGNIGNGSAKADSALIFFVLDARLRLMSEKGERTVSIREFYQGRKKLDLRPDELIVEVLLPKEGLTAQWYYQKVGARNALAISRVSFAGVLRVENGVIQACATAFGAISDVILCRSDLDCRFVGKTLEEAKALRSEYLEAYDAVIQPIRGRISAEYRKDVCRNLLRDFLDTMGIA